MPKFPVKVSLRLVLLIAMIAVGLQAARCLVTTSFHDPLWLDELHTSWVISGPLQELVTRAQTGNQSPLYFAVLRELYPLVLAASGDQEFSLRSLSLLSMLASVTIAATVIFRQTRCMTATSLVAAWICSSDWFLYYGSEARPYALLILVLTIQTAIVWNALTTSVRRAWGWVLAAGIMAFIGVGIHPTAALALAAQVVVLALWAAQDWIRAGREGPGAVCLPLGLPFLIACGSIIGWFMFVPASETFGRRALWREFSNASEFGQWLAIALIPVLIAGGCLALDRFAFRQVISKIDADGISPSEKDTKSTASFRILLLTVGQVLIMAIGVCSLNTFGVPLANLRYVIFIPMLLAMAVGLIVGGMCSPTLRAIALIFCLAAGVSFANSGWFLQTLKTGELHQLRNEDWSAIAKGISNESPNATVVLLGNVLEDACLDQPSTVDARLLEYLRFPLVELEQLPFRGPVVPISTWGADRASRIVDVIRSKGSAVVVARMHENNWQQLLKEIDQRWSVDSSGGKLESRLLEPAGHVHAAFLREIIGAPSMPGE